MHSCVSPNALEAPIMADMATIKHGQLTAAKAWARHLRSLAKRAFWKVERRAEKREVRSET
jgi:hypothetical protein